MEQAAVTLASGRTAATSPTPPPEGENASFLLPAVGMLAAATRRGTLSVSKALAGRPGHGCRGQGAPPTELSWQLDTCADVHGRPRERLPHI